MANENPGVWGIDIGQCALKAIRLEVVDGEVTATAFDYVEHPKILSQPDADPDQLTREALEKFLSRNTIKGDEVAISVPGQSGLARFVKLPPVEEKKIPDIVRFEAKQQIPFPLDEVVWDYQKIGAGAVTDGFAMETEIGLFALKRDMVNRYLQHFQDVNVEVHVVQMSPLALCNFVSYDLLNKGSTSGNGTAGEEEEEPAPSKKLGRACVVALDIGTDNSNLVVTDGERVIWQRPIPFGGNHFTRVLTKDLKLTFAKAEHLKRNATKSQDLKKILASLKPVLNDFVGEVQRSLGYFTNTHRDASIEYMAGLGNAFRLPGMQKFLSEKLQLEVRRQPKFERLLGESVTAAPSFTQNVMSFATAYGLALQGLKMTRLQTNLLPPEIQFDRMVRAKKPWAVTAAASLLVGVLATTIHYALQYRAVSAESVLSAMKDGDDVEAKAKAERANFDKKESEVKTKENALRDIFFGADERLNWLMLVKYVNECLPQPGAMFEGKFKGLEGNNFIVSDRDNKERKFSLDDTLILQNGQPVKRAATTLKPNMDVAVIYNDQIFGEDAKKQYWTRAAQEAFVKHWQRQASGKGAAEAKAEDEGVEDLTQVNIVGCTPLYSTDLKGYLDKVKDSPRINGDLKATGMLEKDQKSPPDGKGWIVELRGYTFHRDSSEFVIATLVNNLATHLRTEQAAAGAKTGAKESAPTKPPDKAPPKPDASAPKKDVKVDASKKDAKPGSPKKDEKVGAEKKTEPDAASALKKIDTAELEQAWDKVVANRITHVALYDFTRDPGGTARYALGSVIANMISAGATTQRTAQAASGAIRSLGGDSAFGNAVASTGEGSRGGGVGNWTPAGALVSSAGESRAPTIATRQTATAPAARGRRRAGMDAGEGVAPAAPVAAGAPAPKAEPKAKPKTTRTDFIVLFVWKEPTPSDDRRGGK
jgi:type IV pilus assembly protein PilM